MRYAVFWPVIALVALTTVVWLRLYATRIGEIRARRLSPQTFATSATSAGQLQNVAAADNFRNLFEVPVLFYGVSCALAITDSVTVAQLVLAWIYVLLRATHSAIHLTYNRVMHRFQVYAASTLCVLAMWALFAVSLAQQALDGP